MRTEDPSSKTRRTNNEAAAGRRRRVPMNVPEVTVYSKPLCVQ